MYPVSQSCIVTLKAGVAICNSCLIAGVLYSIQRVWLKESARHIPLTVISLKMGGSILRLSGFCHLSPKFVKSLMLVAENNLSGIGRVEPVDLVGVPFFLFIHPKKIVLDFHAGPATLFPLPKAAVPSPIYVGIGTHYTNQMLTFFSSQN
jgi:hypothetical protein